MLDETPKFQVGKLQTEEQEEATPTSHVALRGSGMQEKMGKQRTLLSYSHSTGL